MQDECRRANKIPLRINIDESPMPIVYDAVGNIAKDLGSGNAGPRRPARRVERRVHLTLVAMICDVPWIQKLLPQVLVVPERILTLKNWQKINEELPQNVYLLRNKSMWLNTKIFMDVLNLLRAILDLYKIQQTHRCILYVDAFGGHTSIPTLKKMKDCHFWFVLLPANLTYLLQPLDVKTFRMVKRFLRERFASYTTLAEDGQLIMKALRDILEAIQEYFTGRNWSSAFVSLGLSGVTPTSNTLLRELEWDVVPEVPRSRPKKRDVRECTPGGRDLDRDALRGVFPRKRHRGPH